LDVPERPFDAIICLFDSIGYVSTNENIEAVLKNVQTHLITGGLFIFEFWHAGAMIRSYDPLRIRRWQTPEGEILRISETSIDYQKQLCHVAYSIYELKKNGSYNQLHETQTNRFFLLKEMESFLKNSGLMLLKWFSGFQNNELINDETWHVVALAQKQGEVKSI
jgi:SAM-dependent methyltransferase